VEILVTLTITLWEKIGREVEKGCLAHTASGNDVFWPPLRSREASQAHLRSKMHNSAMFTGKTGRFLVSDSTCSFYVDFVSSPILPMLVSLTNSYSIFMQLFFLLFSYDSCAYFHFPFKDNWI
jgi:hypothetical protein